MFRNGILSMAAAICLAAPPEANLDRRLEAALHTEMVAGDLKSAVDQYNAILEAARGNRSIAAKALFQLAQCEERMGRRVAAHAAYLRIVRDYGDQPEVVASTKQRLAVWTSTEQGPQNLDFERSGAGNTPFGWTRDAGSVVEVHREGCRNRLGCAVVVGAGRLTQTFSAAAYRGRTVRLRAWLRLEPGSPGERAQMWLGIDRAEGLKTNVDAARWTQYEIAGDVEADALDIQLGVLSTGKGRVWVDGVSFQPVPEAEINGARTAIQKLYGHLDEAYIQPNFEGIGGVGLADAQYRDAESKEPFRKAAERWTGVLSHRTTVTAFKLSGNGALVNARAEYVRSEANRTRSVTYVDTRLDTWARVGPDWRLKEYRVLASRQVDSTTDAQTAKLAAAELKRTASPLAMIEVGHTLYDLAPFGMAVGEARVVALGEATFGTREFFEIKQRLLEYLVKEKGFTIFAINANWPEAITLDLYIKHGEGDPKALLTGMLWPWNTEEALEVVEWMREFNKAPGTHPTLSFASFGIPPASVVIPRVVGYMKACSPADAATVQANYDPLLEMESRLGEVYDDAARRAADRAEIVVKLLDARRELLAQPPEEGCSAAAWRDARQDAEMARQNAATRISGRGSAYGNEMMARNIRWLAKDAYPDEKIVLWGHNSLVGYAPADAEKSVGTWLREEFGDQLYVTGFAFHRGELLAIGVQNGQNSGVAKQTIPEPTEGNGDSVLSAAGMPVFFLDMRRSPPAGPLGRWLAESHSFLEVGALWNHDDPQSNSHLKTMSKSYDGLIFLEEGHAAHGL
jgi:erythromycin esterase